MSFDISILKEKDKVLIDGKWWKIEENWRNKTLCAVYPGQSWNTKSLEEIADMIEAYEKYVPKIRYNGSVADIEAYIKDNSGYLIYLECIGQEYMVKSITSVLMQGRIRMNDHSVDASFGYFDVHKAGNKRKMINLDDGLGHSILYHAPSIADNGFSVLIGDTQETILKGFADWLEKSQPLPYPKHLTNEIYDKFNSKEKIIKLQSFGIMAVKINLSILENDFHDLQEIILEVCKERGLISPDAKPMKQKAPLPKSKILTEKQVQKIYDTLDKMPKTYETDGMKIKPIGLKLFTPGITWYIVEADKGCEDDEFIGLHPQACGYVFNESYDEGEWGYINIEEVIKCNAEMDLYFENMYINQEGEVGTIEELTTKRYQEIPHCPNCGQKQGVEHQETVDGYNWFTCVDCGHDFKTISDVGN